MCPAAPGPRERAPRLPGIDRDGIITFRALSGKSFWIQRYAEPTRPLIGQETHVIWNEIPSHPCR
jgi:hypothetical protein